MYSRLFPSDASLPARERRFIGISIAIVHILAITWLLRVTGHGELGAGNQLLGGSSALSVTFVTLSQQQQPSPVIPVDVPPPIEPDPENGMAAQATNVEQAAAKVVQMAAKGGEYASKSDTAQAQVQAIKQTAAIVAASSTKGGSPGDDRLASYHAALRAAIHRKWMELTSRPFPSGCALQLTLAVGGPVNATSAASCNLSEADRLQLEAAALMAQPLPYAGYESVFAITTELWL